MAFLLNTPCVSRTSLVLPEARSTFTESARENANSIKMTFLSLYKALLRHLDFFVNSTSVMFKEDGLRPNQRKRKSWLILKAEFVN